MPFFDEIFPEEAKRKDSRNIDKAKQPLSTKEAEQYNSKDDIDINQ